MFLTAHGQDFTLWFFPLGVSVIHLFVFFWAHAFCMHLLGWRQQMCLHPCLCFCFSPIDFKACSLCPHLSCITFCLSSLWWFLVLCFVISLVHHTVPTRFFIVSFIDSFQIHFEADRIELPVMNSTGCSSSSQAWDSSAPRLTSKESVRITNSLKSGGVRWSQHS